MSIVILKIPAVKDFCPDRPEKCPYCQGITFQRWGEVIKPVRDPHIGRVQVYRYRCCHCRRTFRHYPEGICVADQTKRMQTLAVLGWLLGMSYRGGVLMYSALGISLERMSVWRDVQEQAQELQKQRTWGKVRVLGMDGAYVRGWGGIQPVIVAIDLGNGQPVAIGQVDEKDPHAVRKFLEPLVQRLGVSVIVSDDLASYHVVAEQLGLEHQVCQFHLRRWVGRSLHELRETVPKEWQQTVQEVQQLVDELPPEGDKRLVQLGRRIPESRQGRQEQPRSPLDQLRYLIARLAENWAHYRVFDWQPDVPWTNNLTEQAIGRMKMRARTVRGYKSWDGMQHALMLSGSREF